MQAPFFYQKERPVPDRSHVILCHCASVPILNSVVKDILLHGCFLFGNLDLQGIPEHVSYFYACFVLGYFEFSLVFSQSLMLLRHGALHPRIQQPVRHTV